MAKKQVAPLPAPDTMAGVMYLAQAAEARTRMQIMRKLVSDLRILRQDEMRLRRSRKRTAHVDLAVISGQILGLKQALDVVMMRESDGDGHG